MSLIGYAPGGYDMFHIGHLNILKHASHECDWLIAGVVTDDVLLRVKGCAPVIPFEERLEIVRSVRYVDEAVEDSFADKFMTWQHLRFDILFKGDDWRGTERGNKLEASLAKVGAKVIYFPYTMTTSSSALRKRLAISS
jgi:glycerol-3-phosphate cytidylyltransferase